MFFLRAHKVDARAWRDSSRTPSRGIHSSVHLSIGRRRRARSMADPSVGVRTARERCATRGARSMAWGMMETNGFVCVDVARAGEARRWWREARAMDGVALSTTCPNRMDGVRARRKARTKARGVVWCVACVTRETDEKVCDNVL